MYTQSASGLILSKHMHSILMCTKDMYTQSVSGLTLSIHIYRIHLHL